MKRAGKALVQRKERIIVGVMALVIATSCIFALLTIVRTNAEIKALSQFQQTVVFIQTDVLFLQKQTSDFLLSQTQQPVDMFYQRYEQLQQRLAKIETTTNVLVELAVFRVDLDIFKNIFIELVQLQRQIGLTENRGVRGRMRQFSHQVEKLVSSDLLVKQLLQLRRHEKDFIMRHKMRYLDAFTADLLIFQHDIAVLMPANKVEIKRNLLAYASLFKRLVALEQRLGLTAQTGMRQQLNDQNRTLQAVLVSLIEYNKNQVTEKLQRLEQLFYSACGLFFGVLLILILWLMRLVNKKRQRLRGSQQRFHVLTDSMSVLVAQSDTQKIFQQFNHLWLKFSGLPIESLINDGWQALIHPDDKPIWTHSIEEISSGCNQDISIELRLKNQQGHYAWFLFHLRTVCADNSMDCFLVLSGMEISQQKQLQKQLDTHVKEQKVINSLLSFPLERYSLEGLLHRSLVICLKGSFLSHASLGAIFLKTGVGEASIFLQQYGLSEYAPPLYKTPQYRENIYTQVAKNKTIEYIGCELIEGKGEYQHYALPLLINGSLLGVMSLYLETGYEVSPVKIDFFKTVASTLSKLIEQKQSSQELQLSNALFEHSNQSLLICDKNSRIIKVNASCIRTFGYSQEKLIGSTSDDFKVSTKRLKPMYRALKTQGKWQGELSVIHKEGHTIPLWMSVAAIQDQVQQTHQYVVIATNLTKIKATEARVNSLAYYDGVTGIANQCLLEEHLKLSMAEAESKQGYFCLLVIGVDNYKTISDTQGHTIGDHLLCEVVQQILKVVRSTDTLSRFGDEALVLLVNDIIETRERCLTLAQNIAEKVLLLLQEPLLIDQQSIKASISIGISSFPDAMHAISASELIQQASMARHHLKISAGQGYRVYREDISKEITQRLEVEKQLSKALAKQELILYYQPQVDVQSGLIVGAEVLLRWQNEQLGWVSPVDFISIAEESGLILDIGEWVFQQACLQVVEWIDTGVLDENFGHIAVNVSPVQFRNKHFIAGLQHILTTTQVPKEIIEIEVTESALQDDVNEVAQKLKQLKALGLFIAIDDFGTGYSSLGRLKQFPIDLIKIDKSFVDDLEQGGSDLSIVKAIIAMAEGLGTYILAEGVENEMQLTILKENGCPVYQGYLCSKPVPAKEFMALLQAQR